MKKILAILLAGMMTATALVGCGGGDASSKTDNGSKADNGSSDGAAKIEGSIVDPSQGRKARTGHFGAGQG